MAFYLWEDRIVRSDESDDDDEFGSGLKGESKSRMDGSHSLFGIIWSIQKETGWTHKYILWGESWFNIQMKLADAPKMVNGHKKEIESDEELAEFLGE